MGVFVCGNLDRSRAPDSFSLPASSPKSTPARGISAESKAAGSEGRWGVNGFTVDGGGVFHGGAKTRLAGERGRRRGRHGEGVGGAIGGDVGG